MEASPQQRRIGSLGEAARSIFRPAALMINWIVRSRIAPIAALILAALSCWGVNCQLPLLSLLAGMLGAFLFGVYLTVQAFWMDIRRLKEDRGAEEPPANSPQLEALSELDAEYKQQVNALLRELNNHGGEAGNLIDRYRVLTENLAASVVIRDAEGRVTYCSPYTEPLTGYPLSSIYSSEGDFFYEITHPSDRELFNRALHYTKLGEPFQFRHRYLHKTGIEMWAETRTVPVLNDQGNVVSSLSITLDVTRTVRQQAQVEEKNRDLQDFTYMISHDLKAPIFTIKGMLGILDEEMTQSATSEAKEAFSHIASAANRLEQLVGAVLEYSRISNQDSDLAPVAMCDVMNEIAGDYRVQLEKSGGRLEISPHLPSVMGDKLKLYQVFSNLIGNAIKYRSAERPLRIQVEPEGAGGPHLVKIAVKDNGLGISANNLPHIFRPFQRAHPNDIEGFGIGLACVKKLVEKLGGDISVASEENSGSSFVVSLKPAPQAQEAAERSGNRESVEKEEA